MCSERRMKNKDAEGEGETQAEQQATSTPQANVRRCDIGPCYVLSASVRPFAARPLTGPYVRHLHAFDAKMTN